MFYTLLDNHDDLWNLFCSFNGQPGPKFFLDSSLRQYGNGRYSFAGIRPAAILRSRGRSIEYRDESGTWNCWVGDPLAALQQLLKQGAARHRLFPRPFPFCGGLVGYIAYDMGHNLESVPRKSVDDMWMYEQYWGVYDSILVADHWRKQIWLTANDQAAARKTCRKIETGLASVPGGKCRRETTAIGDISANLTRTEYINRVLSVKERIRRGDVYQVNISQRFTFPVEGSALKIYEVLRRINPAPYAAYLAYEEYEILSMSPERFLRIEQGRIETRPIKGTRPRGKDANEDELLVQELLSSEKERAELLMIVDLQRNDLGRLCQPGSIRVGELYAIKKYATVIHQEADVFGMLRENIGMDEVLRCTFPGGSVTGAPKIMAMQIIEEAEPHCRGVYTGSIGYMDYSGDCDLNIAIRTMVIKEGRGYYHAGGGLVADSDPAAEYQETLDKSKVLFLAREELLNYRDIS